MAEQRITQRAAGQAGSALLLMPAALLVLLVLGAIAVDSAIVFTAQRQLADAAAAAANDAAVRAVDPGAFYDCGAIRLDAAAARRSVTATIAARTSDLADPTASVALGRNQDGVPTVTVDAEATASRMLSPAVGGLAAVRVQATATALTVRPGGRADGAC